MLLQLGFDQGGSDSGGPARNASKSVTSPFEKLAATPDQLVPLSAPQASLFRSAVMRLGFLALGRPDVQFAAKEAARGMATPLVRHMRMLRRTARYLLGARALVWH